MTIQKKSQFRYLLTIALIALAGIVSASEPVNLWETAQTNSSILRFSTLFTAQDVRDQLAKPEGLDKAIRWCKETAVTHVYLESFRDGYTADRNVLLNAKKRFQDENILASGCITTTGLGRKSVNGWEFPCFTDPQTLEKLKSVFEYTAPLFDEIMIDDFFATRCECEDCLKAKGEKPWDEFRCNMMVDISKRYVLDPARAANPKVKIILKYPQWYDNFHSNGYEVVRQTQMFDKTWVGTETRDPDSKQWGRKAQYEAYFIMRWLGALGGEKCGGGWFDPYGTSPKTYLEQARQTVLGGAKEAMLFCYGSLIGGNGVENVQALRREIPALFELARTIHGKTIRGIDEPKIPNSEGEKERFLFDFIGMLGLPLVPATEISTDCPAVFLSNHSKKDAMLSEKISKLLDEKKPILTTKHLADSLPSSLRERLNSALILDVPDDLWDLMNLPADRVNAIRQAMLQPFGLQFDAPTRVALYLFGEDMAVIENFNEEAVNVTLQSKTGGKPALIMSIPKQEGSSMTLSETGSMEIPARSLVVLKIQ